MMRTFLPAFPLIALLAACGTPTDTGGKVVDADGDGYDNTEDCDDGNADINPGATEIPYDGVNGDCGDVLDEYDADLDGYALSIDCDDTNAAINPGATDECDGLDNDCDGQTDEDTPSGDLAYADADGDGYGDPSEGIGYCGDVPTGYVADSTDCNDDNGQVHPGATETCNGLDDDCDGFDGDGTEGDPYFQDADGDLYGNAAVSVLACSAPAGYVLSDTDCDDANADIHPGRVETCDDLDNDCDGQADDDLPLYSTYPDGDGDGYGTGEATTVDCFEPSSGSGYATVSGDCDDTTDRISPGTREYCDSIDNNCDGDVDEGVNCDSDTGLVWTAFVGNGEVASGAWVEGQFGYGAFGLLEGDWACRVLTDWTSDGSTLSGCPDCEWAFALTMENGVAEGDYCDQFELTAGYYDGLTYGWGWSDSYTYHGYYEDYILAPTIFIYAGGTWGFFAYNIESLGIESIAGDAESFSFERINGYYYYYRY